MSDNHQLFAVYLGGDPTPGRLSEDHEVVMVVARYLTEARSAARLKWKGAGRPHVDAVQVFEVVDGFRIELIPSDAAESSVVDTTYVP